MQITWISTAGFIGLGLIALPIAIHLLVRQRTRTLLYPSLRFLHETALAAFRRRRIDDAVLLACRVAIIAIAALALAGPIVQTPSRTASYAGRTVRAEVGVNAGESRPAGVLEDDAFRFASFSRAEIADSIRDALRWIDEQPAASREIVFSGLFTAGSITHADLLAIPGDIGIRFLPGQQSPRADAAVRALLLRDGRLVLVERPAQFDVDSTRVSEGRVTAVPAESIRVIAAAPDQPLADAALRAALEEGVRWDTPQRRVLVMWEGAPVAPGPSEVQIVRMPVPGTSSNAAAAIWNALEASIAIPLAEPVRITREQLDAWSRPPGPPSPSAAPADEGDRRWFWAGALLLLGLEQWVRRNAQPAVTPQEARVA
jgi:hypothetical protein